MRTLTAATALSILLVAAAGPAAAHCTYGAPTPQKSVQAPPATPTPQQPAPAPQRNG